MSETLYRVLGRGEIIKSSDVVAHNVDPDELREVDRNWIGDMHCGRFLIYRPVSIPKFGCLPTWKKLSEFKGMLPVGTNVAGGGKKTDAVILSRNPKAWLKNGYTHYYAIPEFNQTMVSGLESSKLISSTRKSKFRRLKWRLQKTGGTSEMTTYNLTAQQAQRFIDTGKLLIVEKIEPQPSKWFDKPAFSHGDGHSGMGWYVHHDEYPDEGAEFVGECPFASVGSITRFREPWKELADNHEATTFIATKAHYAGWAPYKGIKWNSSNTMPIESIRIFGKCVKLEARKLRMLQSEERDEAAMTEAQVIELMDCRTWAWFATFERTEK